MLRKVINEIMTHESESNNRKMNKTRDCIFLTLYKLDEKKILSSSPSESFCFKVLRVITEKNLVDSKTSLRLRNIIRERNRINFDVILF